MTLFRLLRLSGSVLLCLGWPALVGGLSLGRGGMIGYAWFILVFFGWWVYGPVLLGLHRLALGWLQRPALGHSLGVGALLVVLVPGALMLNEYNRHFPTPTIPRFSLARPLDLVNFAVAGALYSWLYWRWVRRPTPSPKGTE